jgi:putative ABC transport system permease protein
MAWLKASSLELWWSRNNMEKLFGLEMASIAVSLSAALILVIAGLGLLALRRPVFFKLGLRPIPRRKAQSALIVLGLMLATLIITAAFITGDTLSYTIRTWAIEDMGEMDELIRVGGGTQSYGSGSVVDSYFKMAQYEAIAAQLSGYPLVDQHMPAIMESVPVVNTTQRRSLRSINVMGLQPEDINILAREAVTDAAGRPLRLEDLGGNEVYINKAAAEALGAAPGDALELYVSNKPKVYAVSAIAAQGDEPRLLLNLRQAQVLFNRRGKVNLIIVSNQGDDLGGAAHSQAVTAHLRSLLSDPKVTAQLYALLRRDPAVAQALRAAAEGEKGNTQADLLALANGLQAGTLSPETRSLLADSDLASRLQSILADKDWGSQALRDRLAELFGDQSELGVDDIKRDTLDESEMASSAFTTIFIVSGLFGISAGLVLIFLIFIMLASERKSEMGMARAVGAQRGHLVEMFVFEGTAYDLMAAAVGVALGVLTGLIIAATLGQAFAGSGLSIRPYISTNSLVVSYSLGMLVTFITVLISANRVSHLNIVSAIRDLPEPPRPPRYLRQRLLAPFTAIRDGFQALFRLRLWRALKAWLIQFPVSLWRLFLLGFSSGLFTLLLGLVLTPVGLRNANLAAYSLGVSFVIIGAGLLLRGLLQVLFRRFAHNKAWYTVDLPDRIAFTFLGLMLTLFWSLPTSFMRETFRIPEMSSGPEMLFIAGFMIVAGAVLVIMYNTELLLNLIMLVVGRSPRFAPVLRMAIAYPLSNRFRTGMTIAIFAIVMFSVIFMATLFKVNDIVLSDTEQFTGGFDLRVSSSSSNPVDDLSRAITTQPGLRRADYGVVASQVSLPVELRQGESGRWAGYLVQAEDEAYLENIDYDLSIKAEGYETAEEIWEAVRMHRGYAVADRYAVPSRSTTSIVIGGPDFKLEGVYLEDESMQPIQVRAREPNTGVTFDLTIIGVLEQSAISGFGLVTSQETLQKALPFELPTPTYFIRLGEGVEAGQAGAALESAFLKNGLESVDQVQELRDALSTQYVFQYLLLGFLTVGLVVGVAALGVISTRAVVERRQQIGMLRALGFQRRMVGWVFLIESSFVALLGIGLGAGLALIPASQMITDMAAEIPGLTFQVPWTEIIVVSGLAYAMSLLTTWLPALQASQITPAEALRYE